MAKGNHKANSKAERLVREVLDAINRLGKGKLTHWHEFLPIVEFNLRTAPHSLTGITPAMALYERDLKKGVLDVPVHVDTGLDEGHCAERYEATQKAFKSNLHNIQ